MRIKRNWGILQLVLLLLLVGCDTQQKPTDGAQHASSEGDHKNGVHPGKALHDANCISCHDASAYADSGRKVKDFPALLTQVGRCNANLNPRLNDKEIVQVADYLNQTFYRYEKQ